MSRLNFDTLNKSLLDNKALSAFEKKIGKLINAIDSKPRAKLYEVGTVEQQLKHFSSSNLAFPACAFTVTRLNNTRGYNNRKFMVLNLVFHIWDSFKTIRGSALSRARLNNIDQDIFNSMTIKAQPLGLTQKPRRTNGNMREVKSGILELQSIYEVLAI